MQLLSGPRWAFRFHRAIITDTVCEKVVGVEMKTSELDKVQQIQSNTMIQHSKFRHALKAQESEGHLIRNCRFLPIESDWGHRAGDPHRPGQEARHQQISTMH